MANTAAIAGLIAVCTGHIWVAAFCGFIVGITK